MKKIRIVLGVFLVFVISFSSVNAQILFNRIYEKPFWNYGDAVIERSDGNYLVVGSSRNPTDTNFYMNALLIDNEGDLIWDKYYGSNNPTYGSSVVETSDHQILILGRELTSPAGTYLVKTDFDGNIIWERNYNTPPQIQMGYSIGETSDNKYYFLASNSENSHLFVTDSNGYTLWSQTYSGEFHSVIETSDGGFALVGRIEEFEYDYNVILQKVDNTGNSLWVKTFGGEGWDDARSIVQYPDGSYVIAGEYGPIIPDGTSLTYLIKTDSSGNSLWEKTPSIGIGHHLKILSSGEGLILSTEGYGIGIMRLDLEGELIWGWFFTPGYLYNVGNNITETSDGGFALAGSTSNWDSPPSDIRLVKLDRDGNYVLSNKDFITKENKISVYPNPTHGNVTIDLGNEYTDIRITVLNILGQLISTNEYTSAKTISQEITASNGAYFIRINTDEGVGNTLKIIKN